MEENLSLEPFPPILIQRFEIDFHVSCFQRFYVSRNLVMYSGCDRNLRTQTDFRLSLVSAENKPHPESLASVNRGMTGNFITQTFELCFISKFQLKDPSRPPPFSMPLKLPILHGEAKSCCFTVSCVVFYCVRLNFNISKLVY